MFQQPKPKTITDPFHQRSVIPNPLIHRTKHTTQKLTVREKQTIKTRNISETHTPQKPETSYINQFRKPYMLSLVNGND